MFPVMVTKESEPHRNTIITICQIVCPPTGSGDSVDRSVALPVRLKACEALAVRRSCGTNAVTGLARIPGELLVRSNPGSELIVRFMVTCSVDEADRREAYITFSHLVDAFIQSDLQMRTIEAIRINDMQVL